MQAYHAEWLQVRHSPALSSGNYCFYHHNLHRLANTAKPGTSLDAIHIEDARGIQIALTQVLSALNSPYMDTRRAGLLLYGLQIASHLTKTASAPEIAESVRTCEEDGGAEIAPEKTVCEPSRDCANCRNQDVCDNYEESDVDQPLYEPDDSEDDSDCSDDEEEE